MARISYFPVGQTVFFMHELPLGPESALLPINRKAEALAPLLNCAAAEKFPHPHIEWFLFNSQRTHPRCSEYDVAIVSSSAFLGASASVAWKDTSSTHNQSEIQAKNTRLDSPFSPGMGQSNGLAKVLCAEYDLPKNSSPVFRI
jgi:hypothetical protein